MKTHHRSDRAPAPLVCVIVSNPRKLWRGLPAPCSALLAPSTLDLVCSPVLLSVYQQAIHPERRNAIARDLPRIRPTAIRSRHRGLLLPTRHDATTHLPSIRPRTTRFRSLLRLQSPEPAASMIVTSSACVYTSSNFHNGRSRGYGVRRKLERKLSRLPKNPLLDDWVG